MLTPVQGMAGKILSKMTQRVEWVITPYTTQLGHTQHTKGITVLGFSQAK